MVDEPKPTLDLASTDELIQELVHRSTFAGIVIQVAREVTNKLPGNGDKVNMFLSPLVKPQAAAIMLSDALNVVLKQPGTKA